MSSHQTDHSSLLPLRIGILSTATINQRALLEPLPDVNGVTITAVASRSAERARKFAAAHGIKRSYGSYDALLDDSAVDAVYISLPNAMHEGWTRRALAAGKHVLCEKPLGMTPDSVEQIFMCSIEARRVLMEAMHYRFHPDVARVVTEIAEERYGRVLDIRVVFAAPAWGGEDIRLRPELGGGALADLGCYGLDLMLWLGLDPMPRECCAMRGPTGVDVRFDATLLCRRSGTVCHLHCDIDAKDFVCEASIATNLGTVILRNPFLPVIQEQGGCRRLFDQQTTGACPPMADYEDLLPSYVHQLRAFRDIVFVRKEHGPVVPQVLDRTRLMTDLFRAMRWRL